MRSADGTEIAYAFSGEGPPLVLVHGTTGDRNRWGPLTPHLEPHLTVIAMDRRGRGESGDAPAYDVEREFEDVAAVAGAVAASSSHPVAVYGHSYGALCALGAATITSTTGKLVLYEAIIGPQPRSLPPGLGERMEELLERGNNEAVVESMFRELLGMTDDDLAALKGSPSWPLRVAAAPTVPREQRTELDGALSAERIAGVTVPTLMLSGSESSDWIKQETDEVASLLPDVRVQVLEGQEHTADVMAPELVAQHLISFVRS